MIDLSTLPIATLRSIAVVILLATLAYWTVRRLSGNGTDPNVSMSKQSDTGSMSVLVSGVDAVALVVLALAIVLWPALQTSPAIAAVLAGIVALHWILEKRERAGGLGDD